MRLRHHARTMAFWTGRIILAAIFISAAVEKIHSPQDFADSLAKYQILPAAAISPIALGLPLFELICGLLLLSGYYLQIGALGILAMLVVFNAAIVIALVQGLSLDCGCFSARSWLEASPAIALIRDLSLFGIAAVVYRFSRNLVPGNQGGNAVQS